MFANPGLVCQRSVSLPLKWGDGLHRSGLVPFVLVQVRGDEGKSGLPVSQDVVLFEKAVRGMEVSLSSLIAKSAKRDSPIVTGFT